MDKATSSKKYVVSSSPLPSFISKEEALKIIGCSENELYEDMEGLGLCEIDDRIYVNEMSTYFMAETYNNREVWQKVSEMGGLLSYEAPDIPHGSSELDTLTSIRNRFWKNNPLRHRYRQLLALHNEMLSKLPYLTINHMKINSTKLAPETFVSFTNYDLFKLFEQSGHEFEKAINKIYEISAAQLAIYAALTARGVNIEKQDIFDINIQIPSNMFISGSQFVQHHGVADSIELPK